MTHQQLFLLNLIIPGLFLLLLIYTVVTRSIRSAVTWPWSAVLLSGALWSSHLASFYLDSQLAFSVGYSWRFAANYLLSLFALLLLQTTISFLATQERSRFIMIGVSVGLIVAALAIDPVIFWNGGWGSELVIGEQSLTQFDIWAAVWGASWFVPLFSSWALTIQKRRNLPDSLYQNQVRYWSLLLTILLVSGGLALVQAPTQPVWHFMAAIIFLLASVIGTATLANRQLPILRLSGGLVVRTLLVIAATVGAAWGMLLLLETPAGISLLNTPSGLFLAAIAIALIFLIVRQLIGFLTKGLMQTRDATDNSPLRDVAWGDALLDPGRLARVLLGEIEKRLHVTDSWVALVDQGGSGQFVVTPLLDHGDTDPNAAMFAADHPFVTHLTTQKYGLVRSDLETLSEFRRMDSVSRNQLESWGRDLYMPLHVENAIVGLIGLGVRETGEAYNHADIVQLESLATQVGPLLVQARAIKEQQRIGEHAYAQNRAIMREQKQSEEVIELYRNAASLITPDMREPIEQIDARWHKVYAELPSELDVSQHDLTLPIGRLKQTISNLLHVFARVEKNDAFQFEPVQIETVVREVVENLDNMAQARRVDVHVMMPHTTPSICADRARLKEALTYLVHNAIKFNKIGGAVEIECRANGTELHIDVADTGVGIPTERIDHLWAGFVGNGQDKDLVAMGLPLTKFIVQAHGGRVKAGSQYGAGSTFSIALPLEHAD